MISNLQKRDVEIIILPTTPLTSQLSTDQETSIVTDLESKLEDMKEKLFRLDFELTDFQQAIYLYKDINTVLKKMVEQEEIEFDRWSQFELVLLAKSFNLLEENGQKLINRTKDLKNKIKEPKNVWEDSWSNYKKSLPSFLKILSNETFQTLFIDKANEVQKETLKKSILNLSLHFNNAMLLLEHQVRNNNFEKLPSYIELSKKNDLIKKLAIELDLTIAQKDNSKKIEELLELRRKTSKENK